MRHAVIVLTAAGLVFPLAATGCKKKEQQPPAAYGSPQPGAAQPGYGQPTYGTTPPPAPAPAAPAPVAGTLSTPGPAAMPCTTDTQCLTAKCHPTVQKCVFPCLTNDDCIAPNVCVVGTGVCAPNLALPGVTP